MGADTPFSVIAYRLSDRRDGVTITLTLGHDGIEEQTVSFVLTGEQLPLARDLLGRQR